MICYGGNSVAGSEVNAGGFRLRFPARKFPVQATGGVVAASYEAAAAPLIYEPGLDATSTPQRRNHESGARHLSRRIYHAPARIARCREQGGKRINETE